MKPRSLVRWSFLGVLLWAGAVPASASFVDKIVRMVSEASYRSYLDTKLYAATGQSRHYRYGTHHAAARQNIFDHFRSLGFTTELHPFTYNGRTQYNVVATRRGKVTPDREYIVGAHYDSAVDRTNSTRYVPGADDNASGVAGIMEMGRVLSKFQFASTIRLIAFDCEEEGLIGSRAYANQFASSAIKGMVSADMIAYNHQGQNKAFIYGRTASNSVKQALANAITRYSGGISVTVRGQLDASDHAPFEWKGIPAAVLIEDYQNNPHYHRMTDSIDTPNYIDYTYATKMTRGLVGWMATAAVPVLQQDEPVIVPPQLSPVPEPATVTVLLVALGLGWWKARRRA